MLRGLVKFTKAQIVELVYVLEKEKFKGTLMYGKFNAALTQTEDIVSVEISEEEAEILLDEINPDTNPEIRKILSSTVLSWRN